MKKTIFNLVISFILIAGQLSSVVVAQTTPDALESNQSARVKEEKRRLTLGIYFADEIGEDCSVATPAASGGAAASEGNQKDGSPNRPDEIKVNDQYKGKASYYANDPVTGYVDSGDNNIPSLPGASNDDPGIAVYNDGTRGGWWQVTSHEGVTAILRQTDVGPAPSTGRLVDLNSVAIRSVYGYTHNDFPTDQGEWTIKYLGQDKPAGAVEKDTGQTATKGAPPAGGAPAGTPAPATPPAPAGGGAAAGGVFGGDLPAASKTTLEASLSADKLAVMQPLYEAGAKAVGIPWQVMAAIHYREGTNKPGTSMLNGKPLADNDSNIDGIRSYADPTKDAISAAEHFVQATGPIYGHDPTSGDLTLEQWADLFVGYNRGYYYKKANVPTIESPYAMNGFDDAHMNMTWTSADETANSRVTPAGKADGQLGALTVMKFLGGITLVGGGGGGGGSGCGAGSGGGGATGTVNSEGYAFPMGGTTKENYGNGAMSALPCTNSTGCHHKGGAPCCDPAFDMGLKTAFPLDGPQGGSETMGLPVYAIHEAEVVSVNDNYDGHPECFSINIKQINSKNSADDGWQYWYGHIWKPKVKAGDIVPAGTQLAEVGSRDCAKDTANHLHIDRGVNKSPGGSTGKRDEALIPLINTLYEELGTTPAGGAPATKETDGSQP